MVDDGALRPGLARPRRLHGRRRLRDGARCGTTAGVSPWIGIPLALRRRRRAGRGGGLSLLPLPHHRPLLRAGHAGAERHRAPGDHRHARLDRRLARLHAGALPGRQLALRAAVQQQDHLVPDRARRVGGRALRLVPRRSQHAPLRAGGDLRGRGRRGRHRRARDRGEAQDHRAERRDDRAGRRPLLPVPDVHLARHGERHLRLAADGLRRRGGRASTCRSARPWGP